jgi:hypothetical protein
MKRIEISDNVMFEAGISKQEELDGHFDSHPYPMLQFNGKEYNVDLLFKDKKQYIWFTRELFFTLASQQKLKCPRCDHMIDFELDTGDASVGMQGYVLAGCCNDDCYFSVDGQTEEIEEELIRELFPLYWRWVEEEQKEKNKGGEKKNVSR